ncbi:MAG: spiro-SPASM protein [Spirochaetales bacterium]|nr:spiro-SPASM protein [Spirochaetales bacterium]
MGNLAVLNIVGLSPLSRSPIVGRSSALEGALAWAASVPELAGIVLIAGPQDALPDGFTSEGLVQESLLHQVILQDTWDESALVQALTEAAALPLPDGTLCQSLFYAWGDQPLLDSALSETLWKLHQSFGAEYTFADGYPIGLAPEILSPSFPARLNSLVQDKGRKVGRDALFEILRKDINSFDVETHLSPVDLRMERVVLAAATLRDVAITEALWAAGGVDAESLCQLIPQRRDLLRDRPAYFPIQICDQRPQQALSDLPQRSEDGKDRFMEYHHFESLCHQILDFAGDAVLDLSLDGDPALHPQVEQFIRGALKAGEGKEGGPSSRVLIETAGLGWDHKVLEDLAQDWGASERLMWIVTLDAHDPSLYQQLRGEGQIEAEATALRLSQLFPTQCWIQAVRMEENEEHLEAFYSYWTEAGAQVIIQKYNACAGLRDDHRPADLAPLDRFPCWHLKRDLPIRLDGEVPLCVVERGRIPSLGNAFQGKLSEIWAAADSWHRHHVAGEYPSCCENCDEYYIFNF